MVNMNKIIAYYAKCNKLINEQMLKIIQINIKEAFECKLNGYFFKTLGELLEHVYISDLNWMKAFLDVNNYGIDLEKETGFAPGYAQPKLFNTFSQYLEARHIMDELIIRYSEAVHENDFEKNVTRVNKQGGKLEKIVWKALIHFFNHQTHHRGQISNILDEMNIENNYSNMAYID